VLRLPDLDFAKRAVLNTLGSPESNERMTLQLTISFIGIALSRD
jgi:hypothetical protein